MSTNDLQWEEVSGEDLRQWDVVNLSGFHHIEGSATIVEIIEQKGGWATIRLDKKHGGESEWAIPPQRRVDRVKREISPVAFDWERVGRQYVARFGHFGAHVKITGSKRKKSIRYHVDEVFGSRFYDTPNDWEHCLGLVLWLAEKRTVEAIAEIAGLVK